MTQTSTTVVTKSTSDLLTAAEVNNMNTVINANSTDSESRVAALEVSTHNALVTKQVVVNEAADLAGVLDSTVVYIINGVIDMGNQSIEVPAGGLNLIGLTFDISKLISSSPTYTMFTSPVGGSGDLLGKDYAVEVTGAGSKVYDLTDATGFNAFEFTRINYNNCSSLGDLYNYRQGLELGTGRFGGSPSLTLHGTWLGGFRVTTSIVRSLAGTMTAPLFKAGTAFVMNSRFLTDINCDLPTLAPLLDFSPSNFPNPGTLQLSGCELTRDGVYVAEDSNITPNVDNTDLCSYWRENNGVPNTYVGGVSNVVSEVETDIADASTYYDVAGTFLGTGLTHFSASSDGKLTHNGSVPIEFNVTANLIVDGKGNDELEVRLRKWDASASSFIDLDYTSQVRQVNNLQGGRDVANFIILVGATLGQGDYLQLQIRNNSGTDDVTVETGSFFRVEQR